MKKALIIALLTGSAISTGCVTFRHMEAGLNALVGQPETAAFNVLGYPSFKQEFGNDTVYVWQNTNAGTYFMPQTATTTGRVGYEQVRAKTTYIQPIAYSHTCTVKIITDSSTSRIKRWEYDGNPNGCNSYMRRLKGYSQEVPQAPAVVDPPRAHPAIKAQTEQHQQPPKTLADTPRDGLAVGGTARPSKSPAGLYKEQSRDSERVKRIYKEDVLHVKALTTDWVEVETKDGDKGWVMRGWVIPSVERPLVD